MRAKPEILLAATLLLATFVVMSTSFATMLPENAVSRAALICER